ncbi:fibulin-1-like [Anarrhichthys ocellatus]|uniref:fibulin-1-like n=1 Tax=Anarrhichthys ocellatus TaxID=433405 RepID=UPI0012EE15E9|nr:fibulin-1-like [Anarrhichthys ocellatus]
MAQWTILLFSLYGALHGQENQLPIEHECCQNGKDWAQERHDCTYLPVISSSSHSCRLTQEQCCAAAVGDRLCDNGIEVAKGQSACFMSFFRGEFWETQISKMCCDCCVIGLITLNKGSSCEFQGLLMDRKCSYTAKACCDNSTAVETEPNTNAPVTVMPQANTTAEPQGGSDPCTDSKCSHLCDGYGMCACLGGYQLQEDGVNCEDVDECLTGSHNCVFGQVCINMLGSFQCQTKTSCNTGYELKDYKKCQDIDECTLGTHNCGPNVLCTNTQGSFYCSQKRRCSGGFIQDAVGSCIDVNECVAHTSTCLPGQTCMNTVGSYTCLRNTYTCGRGYHLTQDGTLCEDVDECRTGNVCGGHVCVNLVGTYRCECRIGFFRNSITKRCEDINECRHYSGRLCAHMCDNTQGSYQCSCATGFKLSHDGRSCDDVNECAAKPCSQSCSNTHGSYQCYCRRGYQLSDIDGITCEDIDECALPAGRHGCSYSCTNAPGSFYCTCPPTGYTTTQNGHTCQDIDECAVGTHTCSVSETCFNILGGFRCLSLACPQSFRKAGHVRSRKDASGNGRCVKVCQPNNVGCRLSPIHFLSHISISLPTFHGDFRGPQEIVFLRTVAVANPVPVPGATDVYFNILVTDDQFSFDVIQRSHQGMLVGVVRQVKPIFGPRDLELQVAMNYFKSGVVSKCNIFIIQVFISEFWF